MRRAGGIVSLTGIGLAIALATPFDSPFGLAQGRHLRLVCALAQGRPSAGAGWSLDADLQNPSEKQRVPGPSEPQASRRLPA